MHDARARHAGKRRGVREQRVHQRAVRLAGPGMNDEACRLVDDDQLGVFVDYLERHALRLRRPGARHRRRLEDDFFPARDMTVRSRLSLLVFYSYVAGFQPDLKAIPGILGKQARQRLVEPQAAKLGRHRGAHRRREGLFPVRRRRGAIIFRSRR